MLNRQNFEIAELAPQDEERLVLCGILVTPGGTYVTNGHQAVMVTAAEDKQENLFKDIEEVIPTREFAPFILDRESAIKVARAIPKKTENAEAQEAVIDATTEGSERAMVSVNDMFRQEILRAKKIEGKYPDIEKFIPSKSKAKFVMRMNPDLLVSVLKSVLKFCKAREASSIEISLYGAGKPLRIDADGNGQCCTAVVMPMRSEASDAEEDKG